jgi:chromosome segregation protein
MENCKLFPENQTQRPKKLTYLNKKNEEYSSLLQEYEKQMKSVLAVLDENERHIEDLKADVMDKIDLLSDKKVQLNSEKVHLDGLFKRKKSIDLEINQIVLDVDKENMKKEDLMQSIYNAKDSLKHASERLDVLQSKKAGALSALSDKRKRQNTLRSEIQFKTSRYRMLKDMEQNLEGYNRSVKQVLQACKEDSSFGAGIRGALAQLITVDRRYETAIEMSLGGALQNVVTDSEEDAKRAIEYLKNKKYGRATFLPISSVKGKYIENTTIQQLKNFQGYCGIGSDLVECAPDFKGIILSLLGRVVIAEDLDAGIRIARKFGYSFRIVTLEGEILNTSGAMTGGSIENKGTGILSRSREIIELKDETEKLEKENNLLEVSINELIGELNSIENDIAKEDKVVKDNELIKLRDENHLAQVNETIAKYMAKIDMLKQEKNQLSRQENEINSELEKYNLEIMSMEKDISETKNIIEQHQEKHKEDQAVRDQLHSDITDYKISVNSIKESMEAVKESIDRLTGETEVSLKSISRYTSEKTKNNDEIASLKDKNVGLEASIRKYLEEKTGKTLEIDRISEEKKVIEEELQDMIGIITEINKSVMLLKEDLNRIEVRKAKIDSELEGIQNRLWEEYELTYTNALEIKKDIGSMTQAQKRINELKSEIRDLGPVNVASIEEYIKTKERYEFMSTQKNDMEQAEEKLYRVINEMISIMKRQFMEQFKLINDNFNKVFKELFEGGKAELILADKDNILESDIEIEVQPPGKKLQNMMLLSGGERAFTAIALLFSILLLRPAPFCILDEIEAALDDANVYRFAEYIRKFTDRTQFIMVTHRKGTMESSDTLYGVTMQEHGISKVVSMKLDGKAS